MAAESDSSEVLTKVSAALEELAGPDGHGGAADVGDLHALTKRYFRHVSADDLMAAPPERLAEDLARHIELAAVRLEGTAVIAVTTPPADDPRLGQDAPSVVAIVTDDMPFLVDSVSMELTRDGHAIQLVIHPQLTVRRDVLGNLLEVVPAGDERPDVRTESWMHVEVDRIERAEDRTELAERLDLVLRDVREAVEDWPRMRTRALDIATELKESPPAGLPADEVQDASELLGWLADDHFTFLGYREYRLVSENGDDVLRAVPGTGLGILRADQTKSASFTKLPTEVRRRARLPQALMVTKANSRSTVHRSAYLDYIGVKLTDETGSVVGERRFLGLFSSTAYTESVLRVPVLRTKAKTLLERAGFSPNSHSGKDLIEILETYPRDELFQVSIDELDPTVQAVLHLQERRQLRVFMREDVYGRFLSCLVYLPRDRYTTDVRLAMQDILLRRTGAASIDYTARVTESVLARLHFVARMPQGAALPEIDVDALQAEFAAATRDWDDDLVDACQEADRGTGSGLVRRYGQAFPEGYKEEFSVADALEDIQTLEALADDDINVLFYVSTRPGFEGPRAKVYRTGGPISLSAVLPVLSHMGVEVVDERPYEVERRGADTAWLYDFGLRLRGTPDEVAALKLDEAAQDRFQSAFIAAWRGEIETDGFNALVLSAGVTWRQAMILRAYSKYLRQAGTTFSQEYIEQCVVGHVPIAQKLVQLFEVRNDPAYDGDRDAATAEIVAQIDGALDKVASLDQDRIIRSFVGLIRATLRTNYYQCTESSSGGGGAPKSYVSFKFDSRSIADLPDPKPLVEVWCYSPRVEGIHLRFAKVARGGLRWSDRKEDFRTEVLGLVKAQAVKNAVIVPGGAKGGFVVEHLPDPSDREAWLAEGIACYKIFISSLLDVTDNLVGGEVVPPPDVVRHDGDDPYLVVAADKGTAAFSDIANEVALSYGFWLGDAFASGGSAGYDHKGMGITARGAWESVKRHFRDQGRDCQTEDFTCVGIGDMSGDVFGNGMLLSEHIRLVAAFDHRDIFLDPDPDAATSYVERRRLFDTPRSSWADYNRDLISAGGGVFSRSLKSIPLTPEVRTALGIEGERAAMTPAELMQAVLTAPVDLLWNGGIGTYVKASTQTHAEVGDKANDAIRVNGSDLRCVAVGEGGNLGFTQLGRVEYALAGGRINTDAIDNSAGVDTSDHEVNIKILLGHPVADGRLDQAARSELLAEMTDEVAELVLNDNYGQNLCIESGVYLGPALLHVHRDYIRMLEKKGELDRAIEYLPSDRQLAERLSQGGALTAPEYAVLLAYTKNLLAESLVETDLPDDPYLESQLVTYFPTPLRERYRAEMNEHRLRREIIVTQVVNNVINNAGVTFLHRLMQETGATADDLVRAHLVAQQIYGMPATWHDIEQLDNIVAADVQTAMRLEGRTICERTARWLVNNRRPPIGIASSIEQLGPGVMEVLEALPDVLAGREQTLFAERRDRWLAGGAPEPLAVRVAALPPAYAALGIVETSQRLGEPAVEVARVHFELGEQLQLGRLLERVIALPRDDRWQTMVRAALRDDVHATHAALTAQVLSSTDVATSPADRVAAWEEDAGVVLTRARSMLDEVIDGDTWDLARLSVGLRVVRTLVAAPA